MKSPEFLYVVFGIHQLSTIPFLNLGTLSWLPFYSRVDGPLLQTSTFLHVSVSSLRFLDSDRQIDG